MTDSQYAIGKNLVDMDKRIDTWMECITTKRNNLYFCIRISEQNRLN